MAKTWAHHPQTALSLLTPTLGVALSVALAGCAAASETARPAALGAAPDPSAPAGGAAKRDPLAPCYLSKDVARSSRVRFRCDGVSGLVEFEADGSVSEESSRLRADTAHDGAAPRFFLARLDTPGRADSLRFERGAGGGVLAVARTGGQTRSVRCEYARDSAAARERCVAIAASALTGNARLSAALSTDERASEPMVVHLDVSDASAGMTVEEALRTHGSDCRVREDDGVYTMDCDDALMAILVRREAGDKVSPSDFLDMMSEGDDELRFDTAEGEVETPRGTVAAKRFTAEGGKVEAVAGGVLVSEGLNDELRFVVCMWTDETLLKERCTALVGALLR